MSVMCLDLYISLWKYLLKSMSFKNFTHLRNLIPITPYSKEKYFINISWHWRSNANSKILLFFIWVAVKVAFFIWPSIINILQLVFCPLLLMSLSFTIAFRDFFFLQFNILIFQLNVCMRVSAWRAYGFIYGLHSRYFPQLLCSTWLFIVTYNLKEQWLTYLFHFASIKFSLYYALTRYGR